MPAGRKTSRGVEMLTSQDLSFYSRYTFRRQLPAEVLVAVGAETALLGQFILARIFQPDAFDITLLFVLLHASFLAAPWFSEQMRARPSRFGYRIAMILAPTAFLSAFFTDGFWGLGPVLVVANLAFVSLLVPLRNRLLRSNYADHERGQCYGGFRRISGALFFGFALAGALLLERDSSHIHWIFPLAGVLSGAGLLLYGSIRVRGEKRLIAEAGQRRRSSPLGVYVDLARLFIEERRFLLYEIGFLLYGMGFMFTVPREIDAVANTLELSYIPIVLGIYGLTPLLKLLFVRQFGRLLDRRGPYVTAALTFGILTLYPLTVWAAIETGSIFVWFAARAAFGLAMAGVEIVWFIGPVTFGDAKRASTFSAAHVFAVGARASIGPFIGLWVFQMVGTGVFLAGAGFMLLASGFMNWIGRRDRALEVSRVQGD